MFNKKKKHFNTSTHKPHYTRQDGQNPSSVPGENENSNGQNPEAVQTASPDNPAALQPAINDPVIYPFKSKSNPNPVRADNNKPNNFRPRPSGRPSRPFQAPSPSVETAVVDPDAPDYSISQNPNVDPNAVPDPDSLTVKTCQICNMPIRSVNTAVHHNVSGELVHFDCALRELSKEFNPKLGRFKKIYYVGAGNFALVKEIYDRRGHLKSYEVLERIPYEAKEK
jgi:hypothetical protein